jgi:multiple sugar transport system substrate-binding protein
VFNNSSSARRAAGASVLAAALVTSLAACGSDSADGAGSGGSASTAVTTIGFWDPYPQHDDSSDWAKYVQACAPSGATIKRTAAPTTDLLNSLTTAVKEDNAPDVVLLDNPAVPEAASSGLLARADEVGIATAGFDPNLAGPGTVDGASYGVPVGANTLGLYYNADILEKAGVDPASLTSWDGLNAALAKVTGAGFKGITFSGIAGEEGVFQALPWYWGAGADLKDPGSQAAKDAGQLLSDWIAKGYAPKSATTDNQSASWDLFLTGEYAFAENGSWFAKAASEQKFDAVMTPIPSKAGGAAPAPTGGEFVVAPTHKENAAGHYAAAKHVIDCLVGAASQVETAEALGYFAPNKDQREQQIASAKIWAPWADAISNAEGRTTDLGVTYPATSAARRRSTPPATRTRSRRPSTRPVRPRRADARRVLGGATGRSARDPVPQEGDVKREHPHDTAEDPGRGTPRGHDPAARRAGGDAGGRDPPVAGDAAPTPPVVRTGLRDAPGRVPRGPLRLPAHRERVDEPAPLHPGDLRDG